MLQVLHPKGSAAALLGASWHWARWQLWHLRCCACVCGGGGGTLGSSGCPSRTLDGAAGEVPCWQSHLQLLQPASITASCNLPSVNLVCQPRRASAANNSAPPAAALRVQFPEAQLACSQGGCAASTAAPAWRRSQAALNSHARTFKMARRAACQGNDSVMHAPTAMGQCASLAMRPAAPTCCEAGRSTSLPKSLQPCFSVLHSTCRCLVALGCCSGDLLAQLTPTSVSQDQATSSLSWVGGATKLRQ